MVELAHGAAHDLDDLGMAVADDGAHLAGAEVEDAPAVGVPHEAALRALGDDRREVAAVAHEMRARLLPEHRIGVARARLAHVVHAALLELVTPHATVIPGLVLGIQPSPSSSGGTWIPARARSGIARRRARCRGEHLPSGAAV